MALPLTQLRDVTMLKATLTIAVISLALLLSTSVFAQNIQYLGDHMVGGAGAVKGGKGVLFYNDLCRDAFPEGQMCDSENILNSGSGVLSTRQQWVKPVMQCFDDGGRGTCIDASGLEAVGAVQLGRMSCNAWSTNFDAVRGLSMRSDGRFELRRCGAKLAVACCKITTERK
jgi:hypothetical protein